MPRLHLLKEQQSIEVQKKTANGTLNLQSIHAEKKMLVLCEQGAFKRSLMHRWPPKW